MFKKIVAFGAHPDDIEIGCFGTINNFALNGAIVDVFVATGTRDRIEETKNAFDHFHANVNLNFLNYENNHIAYDAKTIQDIDRRLDTISPDLVITHWVGDNQQDHQNIAKSVITACRKRDSIWMMEPPIGRPAVEGVFKPNLFVDIGNQVVQKDLAIRCHRSQIKKLDITEDYNPWTARNFIHGIGIKSKAAEAFEVVKQTVRFTR